MNVSETDPILKMYIVDDNLMTIPFPRYFRGVGTGATIFLKNDRVHQIVQGNDFKTATKSWSFSMKQHSLTPTSPHPFAPLPASKIITAKQTYDERYRRLRC